jgi:hypothetical protein
MTTATTYTGSCHCGAVRFEATLELKEVLSCNCSICSRTGALLAFLPAKDFTLLSDGGAQRDYQFGKKRLHHLFCGTCGIRSFAIGVGADGAEMRAINVRCLEGVDPSTFPVRLFDGKSR